MTNTTMTNEILIMLIADFIPFSRRHVPPSKQELFISAKKAIIDPNDEKSDIY
jgi:hypothetical protein